jgi:L-lactate utilization protein LutC
MNARDAFLQRVRQAVIEGNRAGAALPRPHRGGVGYQGAGPDPIQRFCTEFATAGGHTHVAKQRDAALAKILEVIRNKNVRKVVLSRCTLLERLEVRGRLEQEGLETMVVDQLPARNCRDTFFGADLGISGVQYLIAETGSLVMAASPDEPRSVSLLPPLHIALAEPRQILPDLFDLFDLYSPEPTPNQSLPPSCLTLITGPSKTGDIELKLVTGVHGPGEIHAIVCDW